MNSVWLVLTSWLLMSFVGLEIARRTWRRTVPSQTIKTWALGPGWRPQPRAIIWAPVGLAVLMGAFLLQSASTDPLGEMSGVWMSLALMVWCFATQGLIFRDVCKASADRGALRKGSDQ
jgi:hypothetical protein